MVLAILLKQAAVLILSLSEEMVMEQNSTSSVEKRANRILIREWNKE